MPRSNRPRGRRPGAAEILTTDLDRAILGPAHVQTKREGSFHVQPVGATAAAKPYTCPGCQLEIAPGVAHVVAWRADGIFGEADDLAARRHWHTHCWRIRP